VRVRGGEANQLLVLLDGVRANDPASADEFRFEYALTADIERIEIVRGPVSTVWGSDAVSAVVNIIRRKEVRDNFAAGHAEYGSFNTVDLAANGGVDLGAAQLRAGFAWNDTDGINASRTGSEKDGATNSTLDLGLDWSLAEALVLGVTGQFTDSENQFDGLSFLTSLPEDSDRVTRAKRTFLGSDLRWSPADGPWSASANLNWTDTDNENFSDGLFDTRTAAEVLDLRLRASRLFEGRHEQEHRLTAAFDFIDTQFLQRGTATAFGDPNQDQGYDQVSFAGEYVGRLFEGFTWTLSGRHNDFSDFDSIGTWQIAASHQVSEHYRVRGSYGTGFKAPTFTERYGFFPDQFIGNPELVPEESRGWEFGVEGNWWDGELTAGFAYYDQRLKNEIDGFVFDPESFLFTAENRDDDSDRSGFELSLGWVPTNRFSLGANYSYTNSTQPAGEPGEDRREVRRPRHMASVNAHWRFADERGQVNLNVNYTGEQLDLFFDPDTFISSFVTLDAYTVVDLAGSWRLNDALELVGRVQNLFDEDYEEVLGYRRPGVAVYGGIRGRFAF
jgi:vitamin B12 transporter